MSTALWIDLPPLTFGANYNGDTLVVEESAEVAVDFPTLRSLVAAVRDQGGTIVNLSRRFPEAETGWCNERDSHNGAFDHMRCPSCRGFIPDSVHTAVLMVEAREHDARATVRYSSGATSPEAAYVAEHRPY